MVRLDNRLSSAKQYAFLAARKVVPKFARVESERIVFNYVTGRIRKQVVIRGETNNPLAFCVVHYNDPEYLLLNIRQIQSLHPKSDIYVLDNGSQKSNLEVARKGLEKFNNVTLFAAKLQYENLPTKLLSEGIFNSYTHSKGLHFLLNYSADRLNEFAVFLDQDCILANNIDSLLAKFGKDVTLIGPPDYLVVPHDFGPLKKGLWRDFRPFVHASFMILQPQRIRRFLQDFSFETQNVFHNDYHNISFRMLGKIFYLESQMHETIPLLTRYYHKKITYAWHAWYSSLKYRLSQPHQTQFHGLPVQWLHDTRRMEFDYLSQISAEQQDYE